MTSLAILTLTTAAPLHAARRVPSYVNLIVDPGFEAGYKSPIQRSIPIAPWESGGEVDSFVKEPSGYNQHTVTDYAGSPFTFMAHSGNVSFMNAALPSSVPLQNAWQTHTYVRQNLKVPVPGSLIAAASAWVKTPTQYPVINGLNVTIEYTRGAPTTATKTLISSGPGGIGFMVNWERWDFLSVVDKSRTVKAIQFDQTNQYHPGLGPLQPGNPSLIDDVSLLVASP